MIKKIYSLILLLPFLLTGCESFLEQDPEELNTIEKIFLSRSDAIEWFNALYSTDYFPIDLHNSQYYSAWMFCSDDAANIQDSWWTNHLQGKTSPDTPTFGSEVNWFSNFYKGIRHANIFLENVDRCTEFGELEKRRYVAETRFMRAMYHYWLLRSYGPIPIVEKSYTSNEATNSRARNTLDECVNWIISEFQWAIENGLLEERTTSNYGFPTIGAALAIKSRLLLMVASPLYNGNSIYANWKNDDGTSLMYSSYDKERWKTAADAAMDVIELGHYQLLKPEDGASFNKIIDNYRSITTTWNEELIWARPNTIQWYSKSSLPGQFESWNARNSVTLELANAYFMADGSESRPVEEWFANKRFSTEAGNGTDANTFWMFVDREPRFYASTHFPNQYISYAYEETAAENKWQHVEFWYSGRSGYSTTTGNRNATGLSPRKNIPLNYRSDKALGKEDWSLYVPFPVIRFAEIYLNYCEAINEYEGVSGHAKLLPYLNEIRERAGIPGYTGAYTQEQMREMIRRERRVEFAWETQRYFDVRRWFIAHGPDGEFNHPIHGLDMTQGQGATDPAFFTYTQIQTRTFRIEHYLSPIKSSEAMLNGELVQAPYY
ncbi:MAG: RagB/SusD family nutrient uptake outer membrane protein [Mangrovibacterium sp.]